MISKPNKSHPGLSPIWGKARLNNQWWITAVLMWRVGIQLSEDDVFVNVIGGLRIDEPAGSAAGNLTRVAPAAEQGVPATASCCRPDTD